MKPEIHPEYHAVIFVDSATGTEWTSRSTMTSKETRDVEGEEVPVVRLDISSASHPFWTGTMREYRMRTATPDLAAYRFETGADKPKRRAA